jgi:hypothetical protein
MVRSQEKISSYCSTALSRMIAAYESDDVDGFDTNSRHFNFFFNMLGPGEERTWLLGTYKFFEEKMKIEPKRQTPEHPCTEQRSCA